MSFCNWGGSGIISFHRLVSPPGECGIPNADWPVESASNRLQGCHHAVIAINAERTPGIADWQPLPVLSQTGVVLPRPRQFEPESFGGSRVGDWLYNAKETGAKMEIMSETSKIGVRRVTRRDLGVALASITAMEACRRSPRQKYTGALNGFNDKVDTAAFNPMLHTRKLQESAPLRMTFRAKTRAEAEQWQRSLRAKVLELVGGFPEKRSPLQPQTLEVRDFPGYRREKFVFQSRPDLTVLGYLLAPKDAEPPYAPVIALPGHGRGVDDLVGIDRKGRDRTVKVDYQYDYAVQVVEHGMAAVAIEPIGFGCRRDPGNEMDRPEMGWTNLPATLGPALRCCSARRRWAGASTMFPAPSIGSRPARSSTLHVWAAWASPTGRMHDLGGGDRDAHPRGLRQWLLEHLPRQHHELYPLHRLLRAGDSELGRDVRRGRSHRAARVLRGIGREGRYLSHFRQPRQL